MSRRRALAFEGAGPRVVALGGGHGLAATLRALRRVTDQITAVVGVADDGGSSGRLREEFGVLPPGDLRMALAALCGDDTWGRTWSQVVQHRFGGEGDLSGHSIGNLLICALWEQTNDPVIGLDWVGALLEAQGRVLPCSTAPLQIIADVQGLDPINPGHIAIVRGPVAVANTPCTIVGIRIEPANAPVCAE
ncbi:MAG: 2-phospho-L-lactate transferase CofD family protein, partial [Actinomycetes bacterium]